ncbi:hypothetical protein [Burkholderia ubonensis]|uniref:Uncharacterized protein n=1 Tax=Burkholderia ubonensis subsp. mesacidophila TaxID=265293 RepID=A0A2A4FEM8_9BURK|nr:hypothetical protein [Burkholderia ubonensis]PCE31132.1 hypothetical protein BZL54_18070 [Burkholderia ubonensis subsp. mesacidophila]
MNHALEPAPHDAVLRVAIAAAADVPSFDNPPDSAARQHALACFVAALGDRLALGFPHSAAALHALVASPATTGNPAQRPRQQPDQQQ